MKEYYKGEQLYLIGVSSLKRLGVRFIPFNARLSSIPNANDVFVVGRNNPDTQISSGQDTLSLTLDFIAEERQMTDVRDKCNWLRSLRYTKGPNEPQERIKVVWGTLFNREVWVVKNVVINYEHFMRNYNGLPKRAEVELLLGLDGIGTTGTKRSANIYQNDIQNLGGRL
jgi:hypothetical protein